MLKLFDSCASKATRVNSFTQNPENVSFVEKKEWFKKRERRKIPRLVRLVLERVFFFYILKAFKLMFKGPFKRDLVAGNGLKIDE